MTEVAETCNASGKRSAYGLHCANAGLMSQSHQSHHLSWPPSHVVRRMPFSRLLLLSSPAIGALDSLALMLVRRRSAK